MNGEVPRLLVISGLSGSGKTVALHALEDLGYYCVDNLPAGLLPALADEITRHAQRYPRVAAGIDARAGAEGLERLPALLDEFGERARLIFLTADSGVLIRRFSETRRRHPLADSGTLESAIEAERGLLAELEKRADQVLDTSETNLHALRRLVWRLDDADEGREEPRSLILESFAYKHGVPRDADLVFDARCLPNPHWQKDLRLHTGLEPRVREFLEGEALGPRLRDDILAFLRRWLPAWSADQRSHLTVAFGCTGGRHRSVWLADSLAGLLRADGLRVATYHRELEP